MPVRTRTTTLALALSATVIALLAGPDPAATADASSCTTTLWNAGDNGYAAYRIPALISVRGTLVAFAEARRNSASDSGDISVVERRSTDGGCTWTPSTVVSDDGSAAVGNPVPLVSGSGLVLVTDRQGGAVDQDDIQADTESAADSRRIFVQASADAGATWSPRREITASVKLPDWRWLATGPGHGVTIQHGAAVGRLVVPADHTLTTGDQRGIEMMISDDGGRTWRLGGISDQAPPDSVLPDETTAAELPDGRVYVSSRNVGGASEDPPLGRGYTYSLTSGSSLSAPVRPMPGLQTPEVEGSLLQDPGLPSGVSCAPLLYSGPEDPSVREHLTIRRSDDGGITWRTVSEITGPTVPAAYSDMAKTGRNRLGIAYETWNGPGAPARIDFTTVLVGCP